jgi:hypothetical protein
MTITNNTITAIREAIENTKTRSAWERGVIGYALEILDQVKERSEYEGQEPKTIEELNDYMLNGAEDWNQASWGGSYEIYDGDIAERLCTPSELKKTRNGERRPNSREEWLDVQARALRQAAWKIKTAYKRITK